MTNSWYDGGNYHEVEFTRKELSYGSRGEVVFEGENVKITIGYSMMVNDVGYFSMPISFLFEPIGNGLYRIYSIGNGRVW